MEWCEKPGGARQLWSARLSATTLGVAWLGQAGFAFRTGECRFFTDPYLSDFLARKYRGTEFPHDRMVPPPIAPDQVRELDWVLCSHRHSDHMDPGSLPVIARNNPRCRFVVPRAEWDAALRAGIPQDRAHAVNAGDTLPLSKDVIVTVLASAHEALETNASGEHHFLGFIVKTPHEVIYHSGDCVPYHGLDAELRRHEVGLALLPVNGRDPVRASRGIPGNMTLSEARQLCVDARIPLLIPHHFGMFAFNSIDPVQLEQSAASPEPGMRCLVPSLDHHFLFESPGSGLRQSAFRRASQKTGYRGDFLRA